MKKHLKQLVSKANANKLALLALAASAANAYAIYKVNATQDLIIDDFRKLLTILFGGQ